MKFVKCMPKTSKEGKESHTPIFAHTSLVCTICTSALGTGTLQSSYLAICRHICPGMHTVPGPGNPLVPAECSVFAGISPHTCSFTHSHTHRHTRIAAGSYKDHLLLRITTSAWVATSSLWLAAELPLHTTQCLAISALSGRRNGSSWTQDKAGGKR